MLQNTFLHLKGIGEVSERRMWKAGVRTWADLLDSCESGKRKGELSANLRTCMKHFEDGLWSYFDQCIPSRHKWRALGDLGEKALYVDIETTGMSTEDDITVIGTYDGSEFRAFVKGRNLADAQEVLEAYPLIVTFNGACFDLPMIRAHYPYILFNHVHVDLRFPLKHLGYSGGLKSIEKRLGIDRSGETTGLDGWDAVRLWRDHQCGDPKALDLLIQYNEEDVRNMEPLTEFVFEQSTNKLPELLA